MATAVNYDDIRHEINSGDLVIWEPETLFGWLVKLITRSKYVHMGVAWWCYDRLWVLEVNNEGGRPPRALSNRRPFYWIPAHVKWNNEVGNYAFNELDNKYSYITALKAAFKFTWKKTKGLICTGYVANVLYLGGNKNIDPNESYTPIEFIMRFKETPVHVK